MSGRITVSDDFILILFINNSSNISVSFRLGSQRGKLRVRSFLLLLGKLFLVLAGQLVVVLLVVVVALGGFPRVLIAIVFPLGFGYFFLVLLQLSLPLQLHHLLL